MENTANLGGGTNLEINRRVGRNLKIVMTATGLTQHRVAQELGMSDAAMSDRVAGRTSLSADEIVKLARFFGVDPGVFFREDLIPGAHNPACGIHTTTLAIAELPDGEHQLHFHLEEPPELASIP